MVALLQKFEKPQRVGPRATSCGPGGFCNSAISDNVANEDSVIDNQYHKKYGH